MVRQEFSRRIQPKNSENSHRIVARCNGHRDTFCKICEQQGGTPLDMADAAYVFHVLPRIPVALLFWEGDEDFPAEAKLLFDQTLTDHFALDIIFAMAVGVCETLSSAGA